MPNINAHISVVERAVSAHDAVLHDANAKAAADRDALLSLQSQEAARLSPIATGAADLRNRLTELTSRHRELSEALKIGRWQLICQKKLEDEFRGLITRNLGHVYAYSNPGIFMELLANRPAGLIATITVPMIEAWITEHESALEETEAQLAELARSAKHPLVK